ncbi:Gfo/Idh/MocA family oxidoreductase [Stigmatella sp. ncwal1]|uniref:Gfo/Idh/MocA family oxidoreductase n=1 Tax=Stigmatella ashevillensis TaxID=2995309 RepID=A0ABT5D733_9BACT|nr:Gfo/Idh/MocA family oxidoreductase [Stigmatella ashevillena]MDC0709462.1 Gfo/Idh/MocA family oxidoreductase [Stigmatella ashevillena]
MTKPLTAHAPLRAALLGYGFAGKVFHAPLVRTVEGLTLRVVASSRPDDVRAEFPNVEIMPSAFDAATHPDVDLVVVATPNETHVPLAEAALRAGKHVIVDKPFTVTLAEARSLVALASGGGCSRCYTTADGTVTSLR